MSEFDHDAAMHRGAERQKITDDFENRILDMVEKFVEEEWRDSAFVSIIQLLLNAAGPSGHFQGLPGRKEHELRAQLGFILADLRKETFHDPERRKIIFDLAIKTSAGIASRIATEFSHWESKTFRK